jgi:hypothetical protein
VVVSTSVEPLKSSYSLTATLSVAASQAKPALVLAVFVARRFLGAVGGSVSLAGAPGGVGVG